MAIYTAVDEGYDVEVFTSFDALLCRVAHCDWMDKDESKPLTADALKAALKSDSEAKLYESDSGGEWTIKVRKHAA